MGNDSVAQETLMSKHHWLALVSLPGVGGATGRKLLERFGGIEAAFDAPDAALAAVPRLNAGLVARLRMISLEAIEAELAALADEGLSVLTWDDADYPANLRPLPDAPPALFVRGDLRPGDAGAVAIIGTREPTAGGAAAAERIGRELAGLGLTVVSGLAIGIDTAAHRGALAAAGGRTLAVPGSGLRAIHPRQNAALAGQIARCGALLSELHPNTPPSGPALMARDRIVSGLARAVIVVEAGEKSGSLDTAAKARRQGRLLLALPGSPGTDRLLAEGAERLAPNGTDFAALARRIRGHALPGDEERGRGARQPCLWG
jgi:DNA processing protein